MIYAICVIAFLLLPTQARSTDISEKTSFERASALVEQGDYPSALALIETAQRTADPRSLFTMNLKYLQARCLYEVAQTHYAKGNYSTTLALFEKLVAMNPQTSQATTAELFIGRCYGQDGKWSQALLSYDRFSRKASPRKLTADDHFLIGRALLNTGRSREAYGHFREILHKGADAIPRRLLEQHIADCFYTFLHSYPLNGLVTQNETHLFFVGQSFETSIRPSYNSLSIFDKAAEAWSAVTMDDSFVSGRVYSIAADSDDLWLGTNKGLVRLRLQDRKFEIVRTQTPGRRVTSLVADDRNLYMVGAGGEITIFRKATGEQEKLTVIPGAIQLLGSNNNYLFAKSDKRLFGVNKTDGSLLEMPLPPVDATGGRLHDILNVKSTADGIWIAASYSRSLEGRSNSMTYRLWHCERPGADAKLFMSDKGGDNSPDVMRDIDNEFIYLSEGKCNRMTKEYSPYLLGGGIVSFIASSAGFIYLGRSNDYAVPPVPAGGEDSLWVIDNRTNRRRNVSPSNTAPGYISSIVAKNGYVWCASGRQGIRRYDRKRAEWSAYLCSSADQDVKVNVVADTPAGLLAGTSEGARKYNPVRDRWERVFDDRLAGKGVHFICVDGTNVWFTITKHPTNANTTFLFYNTRTGQWHTYEEIFHQGAVFTMAPTKKYIWSGGYFADKILNRFDKRAGRWEAFDRFPGIFDLYSMVSDDSHVWGTFHANSFVYDERTDCLTQYQFTWRNCHQDGNRLLFFSQNTVFDKKEGKWFKMTPFVPLGATGHICQDGDFLYIGMPEQGLLKFDKKLWDEYFREQRGNLETTVRLIPSP